MMMNTYDRQLIDGIWREGSGEAILENRNPYNDEVLYRYRSAGSSDVEDAYLAAETAQKAWSLVMPDEKRVLLEQLVPVWESMKDEFFEIEALEGGFARRKALNEFKSALGFMRYARCYPLEMSGSIHPSNVSGKENYVYRTPKGVICVIAPWNVPFVLALRSIIPAVALGNAVVLKPSSDTPASGLLIGKLFEQAGFPGGLVNVVAGKGSEIGDCLLNNPIPSMISFTGSTEVGKRIGAAAGEALKDVALELGGNNAMVVLGDANIEAAACACTISAFSNSGQVCMAVNRAIVVDKVYDEFCTALVEQVSRLKVGSPLDPDVFIGPVINGVQREKIEQMVKETLARGGVAALEGRSEGNLIYPWVIREVTNDMPTARNEVFGPVCSLVRASDEEEAISIANDTKYGLSGSVFTSDLYNGIKVARRMRSGMIHVNDKSIHDEPHVMFGGNGNSGIGRFNGRWALEKFTIEQWVSVQNGPR